MDNVAISTALCPVPEPSASYRIKPFFLSWMTWSFLPLAFSPTVKNFADSPAGDA